MIVAVAIMVFDVAINTTFAILYRDSVYGGNIDLIAQTAFLALLLFAVPIGWRFLPGAFSGETTVVSWTAN